MNSILNNSAAGMSDDLNPFRKNISRGVSIFTGIKNRLKMLEQTLPTWIKHEDVREIVVVNWSSDDNVEEYIKSLESPKILLANVPDQPRWSQTLAFNLAARLTSHEILLKMDADVKLFPGFFKEHPLQERLFYTGDWRTARNENEKHLNGICYIFRNDFFSVNGYNERLKTYAWDDIDLYKRLEERALIHSYLNPDLLHHMEHAQRTTFHDYMSFLDTEQDMEKALLNSLINRFIVESSHNWDSNNRMLPFSIETLSHNLIICRQSEDDPNPMDPEILRQCEAKAIVERFYELGVKIPADNLRSLSHPELIDLINLYYQRSVSAEKQRLFNIMLKLCASQKPAPQISTQISEEKNTLLEKIGSLNSKIKNLEAEIEKIDADNCVLHDKINNIHSSYSWKIGHGIASGTTKLLNLPALDKIPGKTLTGPVLPMVNLGEEIGAYYGQHRSGWGFAIASLAPLHKPDGIVLDSFIERTFQWHHKGVYPHKDPWIGFIHVPPGVPEWFSHEVSNQTIFGTTAWQQSLPHCKGLFTLSKYHKNNLEALFDFPINNLLHPTGAPLIKWNWENFLANKDKQVVQIGFWLRKLWAIHVLKTPSQFRKVFIRKENVNLDHLLEMEKQFSPYKDQINEASLNSVQTISYLSDAAYDRLLSENIVFLDLYDASANNSVIECIVRNTPILVNPIEPVVEYLGEKYPFYYTGIDEATAKLHDNALIRETHRYLTKHPVKHRLTSGYFLSSVANSKIYKSL